MLPKSKRLFVVHQSHVQENILKVFLLSEEGKDLDKHPNRNTIKPHSLSIGLIVSSKRCFAFSIIHIVGSAIMAGIDKISSGSYVELDDCIELKYLLSNEGDCIVVCVKRTEKLM